MCSQAEDAMIVPSTNSMIDMAFGLTVSIVDHGFPARNTEYLPRQGSRPWQTKLFTTKLVKTRGSAPEKPIIAASPK
jgi:hypothetical protein